MLAENLHRRGLSAVEEARGVQAMLDLGVFLTRVAKSTGLGRKRVAKAAGVSRLDGETAAAVAGAGLTLDQAAAVAVYADDPDTTAALIAAAGEGPGQFAHALTRAKQAKQEAELAAALRAELASAGRTVLDEDTGRAATRLTDLTHDGRPLTTDGHAGCPGSAVSITTTGWSGPNRSRCAPTRPATATATAGRQTSYRGARTARNPATPSGRPPRPSGRPPSKTTRRWRRPTRPAASGSRACCSAGPHPRRR